MMICTYCNEELPVEFFEFRSDVRKYRRKCKVCRANTRGHKSLFLKQLQTRSLFEEGKKKCSNCLRILDLLKFSLDANTKYGYYSRCKECVKKLTNKNISKNIVIRNRYGITLIEYEQMLVNQENRCKICKNHMNKPNIDHCHITGKVRGILCNGCNSMLGMAKDNVEILKAAIEYLK